MRALILLLSVLFPVAVQARSLPIADPQMIAALEALVPDLPEWNCAVLEAESAMSSMRRYLPVAALECRHQGTSITLLVVFDPDHASTTCTRLGRGFDRQSENAVSGIAAFEKGEAWISERTGRGFLACSADQIVVQATLEGDPAGVSGDGTAFDLFHKALITADAAKVLRLASESKKRLDEAFSILNAETNQLELLLPHPDGWEITDSFLAQMERLEQDPFSFTAVMRLMGLPTVGHTLLRGNCRIIISLSASPEAMHDAGLTFAQPGIRDGVTGSFWRNRKTDRFHGQEALDGSRYQIVVDNAVVLRINATGDCSREDGVATSLYEAIKNEDMSRFRLE